MKKIVLIVMLLVCAFAVNACCAEVPREVTVIELKGDVQVKTAGQETWQPATLATILHEKDTIKTAAGAEAVLNVGQAGQVSVRPESEMTFDTLVMNQDNQAKQTMLDLAMGNILIKAQKLQAEEKFEVKTPTAIMGVRGTEFEVTVAAGE